MYSDASVEWLPSIHKTRQEASILKKTLTALQASAMLVGVVVGIGIFKTPPVVAANVSSEMAFLGLWLLGGVVTLIGALCYAELATAYPHVGGEYHFLRKALETIECRDALLNDDGTECEWPSADVILGNPPFLGSYRIIGALGEAYTTALRRAYEEGLPGTVDLVMYWFWPAPLKRVQFD